MSIQTKEVPVTICDGCGQEIDTIGLEQNVDWYEVVVRVHIPHRDDWHRLTPLQAANDQIKEGTSQRLHCHKECTIKGKMFRRVLDAMEGQRDRAER